MKAEKLLEGLLEASYTIIARELNGKSKCCKQCGNHEKREWRQKKKIDRLDREWAFIKFYT